MDQKVEMTTPTTSAWAAIASIELVTVSNIRMELVSDAGTISGIGDLCTIDIARNLITDIRHCVARMCN